MDIYTPKCIDTIIAEELQTLQTFVRGQDNGPTRCDKGREIVMLCIIRESVDSLCRDGADTTRPLFKTEWLITPKRGSYKPF